MRHNQAMNEDDAALLDAMVRGREDLRLEQLRRAKAKWLANPSEPYLVTFSGPEEDRPHTFCPEDRIAEADCPNCRKPLLMLASFETQRLPFSLGDRAPSNLHLLYCWTCAIPYDWFSYRIGALGEVEVIEFLDRYADALGPAGPYEGYTGVFPQSRVGLRALTHEEQELALQLQARGEHPESLWYLTEEAHQIGGIPKIWNLRDDALCPMCSRAAPFFATICDNAVGQEFQADRTKTFTGNCGVRVVFHYCAACSVMKAYHSCD
jgi:hypothetical protein